jgi:prepilin-type N-terminal cleavage/methylation domain-containing protein
MNRRRGFTLLEMVVAISVSTVLMGIAVTTLIALLRNQNTGREHLQYCRSIERLAEQFRRDVHGAEKISAGEKEGIMEIPAASAEGATIRYQCFAGQIERTESKGGKIVSRESYILAPATEAALQVKSPPEGSVASIVISPRAQAGGAFCACAVRIESVVGLDKRLGKIEAAGEAKP